MAVISMRERHGPLMREMAHGARRIATMMAIGGAAWFAICTAANAADYSEGFRMGQLSKYSERGLMSSSGEGELMMGNDSSPWIITHRDSKGKVTQEIRNPWAFSSDLPTLRQFEHYVGEYVVIQYRQLYVNNPLAGDTNYRVVAIRPVSRASVAPCAASSSGSYSKGTRVGRLVKVSTKGAFVNSYEVTMQVGNAGGTFIDMTITDPVMYGCAKLWLMSGRQVKVGYSQSVLHNPLASDTSYVIDRLEPVAGLPK